MNSPIPPSAGLSPRWEAARDIPRDAAAIECPAEEIARVEQAPFFLDSPATAELVADEIVDAELVSRGGRLRRIWGIACRGTQGAFGLLCLLVGLAVLASAPLLQFLTLGYLLEASGRVTRSGRLRDGFFAVHGAGRIGGFVIGAWLWLLPLRWAADMRYNALLIDPQSRVSQNWRTGLAILTAAVLVHICWAWLRGGKLRHFLWPAPVKLIKTLPRLGSLLGRKADELWEFVAGMRIPHYFWMGLRGFAGATLWLFLPTALLIAAPRLENPGLGVLVGLQGGALMAGVLLILPFLQAHFAAENRFRAFFEVRRVGSMFCCAPLAFWFALFTTLLFALPLYLFKIEILPREALWLPGLVFVAFIYPARLLTGWALARARRRQEWRAFPLWLLAGAAAIPVVAVYTFFLNLTQYVSWYGALSLFEQHAFLTPAPFFGG